MKELTQTSISVDLKSKLALLSSNEGKLDFKKEIEEPKHNLFNLIKQYSIKLNLFEFISLTPRIAVFYNINYFYNSKILSIA